MYELESERSIRGGTDGLVASPLGGVRDSIRKHDAFARLSGRQVLDHGRSGLVGSKRSALVPRRGRGPSARCTERVQSAERVHVNFVPARRLFDLADSMMWEICGHIVRRTVQGRCRVPGAPRERSMASIGKLGAILIRASWISWSAPSADGRGYRIGYMVGRVFGAVLLGLSEMNRGASREEGQNGNTVDSFPAPQCWKQCSRARKQCAPIGR